jgi:streptogramin lyase
MPERISRAVIAVLLFSFSLGLGGELAAQDKATGSRDRGNGFVDHGVAVAVCRARGVAATVDKDGKPVILIWLGDHRGARGLLMLDAITGQGVTYPVPTPEGDSPYAIVLSKKNKFYALYENCFLEFDPISRSFTFVGKDAGGMAMSMTEDSQGVIWAANYPGCNLVSFNPATRQMVNHGPINKENWPQYPSCVAVDKSGWVYVGIGETSTQIVAFNPQTREIRPLAKKEERKTGMGIVFLGADGVVYGNPSGDGAWYALSEGKATPTQKPTVAHAALKQGDQETVLTDFPDGRRIQAIDVPEKWVEIREPDGAVRRLTFDYASDGAYIASIALGPDGRIYGGSGHPLRVFAYDPVTDRFTHHGWRNENGHWNALAVQRGRLFGGMYYGGYLFDYDVTRPWNDATQGETNPKVIASGGGDVTRPHALLAHPDGHHLIMAGTPAYGYTGGGMLIYDLDTGKSEILDHKAIVPELSTLALDALDGGKVLVGGTTINPGTGGEAHATQAELYLMDFATRKVTFHAPIVPGAQEIRDVKVGPDGLVYGVATGPTFFAFDPKTLKVVHQEKMAQYGKLSGGQGPRTLLFGPDGKLYVYFTKAIVRIEPGTFKREFLAAPPVLIDTAIALREGRLYFESGGHLWSWKVPDLK